MSDCECAYALRDVESETRGLRQDVDNLLGEMMALRQANADLTKLVRVLRDRVDANEMAPV